MPWFTRDKTSRPPAPPPEVPAQRMPRARRSPAEVGPLPLESPSTRPAQRPEEPRPRRSARVIPEGGNSPVKAAAVVGMPKLGDQPGDGPVNDGLAGARQHQHQGVRGVKAQIWRACQPQEICAARGAARLIRRTTSALPARRLAAPPPGPRGPTPLGLHRVPGHPKAPTDVIHLSPVADDPTEAKTFV